MAQDGNWQAEAKGDDSKLAAMRAQAEQKLVQAKQDMGKLGTTKVQVNPDYEARRDQEDRRHTEREAAFRRQFALEQAVKVVTGAMDWVDADGSQGDGGAARAGKSTLEMADRFARWMETGTLPQS